MSDDRNALRRRTNQTNITVGVVANLLGGAAVITADTLGWAQVPMAGVVLFAGLSIAFFVLFTVINQTRREYTEAFMDRFFWATMLAQIPVFGLGALLSDDVRPIALLFSMVLLAMLFLRADFVQALAYGLTLAGVYLCASAAAPWLIGGSERFAEDVFNLMVWTPTLGVMAFLAGQQHRIRARLTEQREAIESFAEQRAGMFRRVSHAIRTPLTMILAPLDKLLTKDPTSADLKVAYRNAKLLEREMGELLRHEAQIAQSTSAGLPELESVEVSSFAARIVAQYFGVPGPADVRVSAHGATTLYAFVDPMALERILTNYISNAIKYSPPGGRVRVITRPTPQGPRIVVSDTGPGIPHGKQRGLFSSIGTLGDPTSRRHGTGFGLAIVREEAAKMGAKVGVDSREGHGSHFWLQLQPGPLPTMSLTSERQDDPTVIRNDEQVEAAVKPRKPVPTELPDGHLLVVEDDADLRDLVVEILESAGWTVVGVENADVAIAYVGVRTPELIVTDWMMPGTMNGPQLVQAIRQDPERRSVPIVMLTARADAESRATATAVGADAFIGKPFDREELIGTVTNLLRLKERERDVRELNRRLREEVFGRFLPPRLVEDIVEGRASLDDAPVTRVVTTLVVDIARFGPMTEHLRARGVAQFLADYFKLVTDLVFEHQGFVDKYLGDGVLVHFGVPVPAPREMQLRRATACARDLHRRVRELDEDAGRRPGATRLRIGIHQGRASVGYFGTAQRSEYTAVGPSVNLALRIRSVCRPGATFVSAELAEALGRGVKLVGEFDVRDAGNAEPLYQLVDDNARLAPTTGRQQVLSAGETFGPYTVQRLVGRGAIAVVYEVRHEKLDRANALKVLLDKKPEMTARLAEEGRIQGRLQSPYIVPVIDVIDVHGMDALVMPLVEGCSLDDLLTRFEPSEGEAVAIALAVARALGVAHRASVVHRDLKPGNVLLDTSTGVVVPRVADFGLARAATGRGHQTIPGQFVGTPIYAAPEQYQDATRVGPPADVWALGALFYELLTGRCPFVNGPFSIIREQVVGARYDERLLPKRWRALVQRMLTVDPELRPLAEDVAETLAKAVPDRDPLAEGRLVAMVRNDEPTEVFGSGMGS